MRELTCIVCPLGCRIKVGAEDGRLRLEGYGCRRGGNYARNEAAAPKRVVTGVVAVEGGMGPLPVKTAAPVPKECIFQVMAEIRQVRVRGAVRIGQILRENLSGTGVALIATKNLIPSQNGES